MQEKAPAPAVYSSIPQLEHSVIPGYWANEPMPQFEHLSAPTRFEAVPFRQKLQVDIP